MECGRIMVSGKCLGCGWIPTTQLRSRPVVGTDGKLRMMQGDIYRQRPIYQRPGGEKIWERIFWAGRKHKTQWTFRQAALIFAMDHQWRWPDRRWPFMPLTDDGWYRQISVVPFSDLVPKGEQNGKEESERGLFV